MVKGCQKKMIILKNVDSDTVEQVQLIMREGLRRTPTLGDMAKEAERIISENVGAPAPQAKKKRRSARLAFLAGILCSAAVLIPLFLLLR